MTKATLVTLVTALCIACSSSHDTEKPSAATVGTVRAALSTLDYKSQVLNDGAVGYWRLGDTGPNALDSAPRGNAGTYTGRYTADNPTPIPNQNQPGAILTDSDRSAQFYISNNYNHNPVTQWNWVSIPPDPNQSPTTASLTVEAWFTITAGSTPQTYSALVFKSTSNMQDGYGIYWYSNTLYFWINNLNIRVGVPLSAMGDVSKFHHVVGTYDGTAIKIYYDGAWVNTLNLTAAMGQGRPVNAPTAAGLNIGAGWGLGWGGRIDEVAIYPNALDAAHILSHFQAARPPGPLSRAFVAYAQQSLTFGTGDHVSGGDVGVASLSSQTTGSQLVIGDSDVFDVQRGVIAPSVSVGSQAQVGNVSTNALTNNGGSIGAQQSFPASMPLLPLVPSGAPGTTNITVAAGRTQTIYPGNYRALVINGTVLLSPGAYSFSSIVVGNGGILADAPFANTTIRVDTTLTVGTGATVFQQNYIAGGLVISVAGSDASSSSPAVSIGANSALVGVLNAPHGTVSIGDGSSVTGALAAFAINVGNNVTMALDAGAAAVSSMPGQLPATMYSMPPSSPVVGVVPPDTQIAFNLALPVRNLSGLEDAIARASNPNDPNYRHWVDPATFASTYAPSSNDTSQIAAWAQSFGLSTFTYPHNTIVTASGTAAQIERALSINLVQQLRPDGSVFYGPDRPPAIDPTSMPATLLGLTAIDNFFQMKPLDTGGGPGNSYLAGDLRAAYVGAAGTCSALNGQGQFVGLVSGAGFNPQAVNSYVTNMGLVGTNPVQVQFAGDPMGRSPGCPTCDNSKGIAPPKVPNGEWDDVEMYLDIDMVLAMAPAAQIILFQGPSFLADIAANPQVAQVSSSWGIPDNAVNEQLFKIIAAQGQSFFGASHDSGSYQPAGLACPVPGVTFDTTAQINPTDFVASPWVTAVGGTVLTTSGPGGIWQGEVAWPGSGGGVISAQTMPSFQNLANPTNAQVSMGNRNVPDVSAIAQNLSIFASGCNGNNPTFLIGTTLTPAQCVGQVCDASNKLQACPVAQQAPVQMPVNGTSASSPLWAGFMALVNQSGVGSGLAPVGYANPLIYELGKNGGAFHDITVRTGDSNPCGFTYNATPGYDLATGWGSPSCSLLSQMNNRPTLQLSVANPLLGIGLRDMCGVDSRGGVECWGLDSEGEDGTGTSSIDTTQHLRPVCTQTTNPGAQASAVAMGAAHACALVPIDGKVRCWGDNTFGQLGTPGGGPGVTTTINGLRTIDNRTQIAAGGGLTCVLYADLGDVWCWGQNNFGQLGTNTINPGATPVPAQVLNLPPATQIAIAPSGAFACALLQTGGVDCWGLNHWGNIGNGTIDTNDPGTNPNPVLTPQPVLVSLQLGNSPLANAGVIAVGDMHACAITGCANPPPNSIDTPCTSLVCWGNNGSSQLGEGSVASGAPPHETTAVVATQLTGLNPVAVAAADSSTCVIDGGRSGISTGSVYCWGDNTLDELGDGTSNPSAAPVFVQGVQGANALAAGETRICARSGGDGATCWGGGPIGDGTNNTLNSPKDISFASQCP